MTNQATTINQLFAELYRARGGGYELSILEAIGPRSQRGQRLISIVEVAGKREARKIAAQRGATPWNF